MSDGAPMPRSKLLEAARSVQDFVQSQGWRFCFIGGLVVQRWGIERATKDADLTVLTRFSPHGNVTGWMWIASSRCSASG